MQGLIGRFKSINPWVLVGVVVVIIAAIAYWATNQLARPSQPQVLKPSIATVSTGDLQGAVTASGQLKPEKDVALAMAATGIVTEVKVAVGDKVTAGQVLVRLDDTIAQENVAQADLAVKIAQNKLDSAKYALTQQITWSPNQSQLNAAQANLANAQAAVNAAQSNYDKVRWYPGVSSTAQSMALEQATNNYNRAKADMNYLLTNRPDITLAQNNVQAADLALQSAQVSLKMAKDTLDKLTLTAPIDGTVSAVNVDVGEAAAGPVVELVTADQLEVVLDVDEGDVGALKLGQPATVTFEAYLATPVTAKVISIAPKANAMSNVVNFEVHLGLDETDLDLRAGMTANVSIQTFSAKNVVLAPNAAIFLDQNTGKNYVNLITPQGAQKTEVVLGSRNEQYSEIASGVKPGDQLLIGGSPAALAQTK